MKKYIFANLKFFIGVLAFLPFFETAILNVSRFKARVFVDKMPGNLSENLEMFLDSLLRESTIFEVAGSPNRKRYATTEKVFEANWPHKRQRAFKIIRRQPIFKPHNVILEDPQSRTRVVIEIWDDIDGVSTARTWNPRAIQISSAPWLNVESNFDGRVILTHPDLSTPNFDEPQYPIDAVYLWVNGDDQEWAKKRDKYVDSKANKEKNLHSVSESRFRNSNELIYSLRSLSNTPWINHIYLVTDAQIPDWFDTASRRVTVIDHKEIMPAEALPTFNSHAIVANIHRICGLTENFLYFNDDIFVGTPIPKSYWFSPSGMLRLHQTKSLQPGSSVNLTNPVVAARRRTMDIAKRHGLLTSPRSMQHAPHPMRRSIMEKAWQIFPAEMQQTTHSKFRDATDVVPEWLHNFLAMSGGLATVSNSRSYRYLAINSRDSLISALRLLLQKRRPAIFCLNDSSEVPPSQAMSKISINRRIYLVLEGLFPSKSEFEKL